MKTVEEWTAHWDGKAAIDNPVELNGYCVNGKPLTYEEYYAAIVKPNVDICELQPHHHLLEVGCGSGVILTEIEKEVEKCVGTDISQAMLSKFGGKSETVLCAAHELGAHFGEGEFDRILCVSVAIYFPSFKYFKSFVLDGLSILKTGGIFLIGDLHFGRTRRGSQYTFYDKHEMVDFLDSLDLPYSIAAQSRPKRAINRRSDVILYKD